MAKKKSQQATVLTWVGVVAVVYVLWKVLPAFLGKLASIGNGGSSAGPVGGVGSVLPQLQQQQPQQQGGGGGGLGGMMGAPSASFGRSTNPLKNFLASIDQFNQQTMPYFDNLQSSLDSQIAQGIDNYTIQSVPLQNMDVNQFAVNIPGSAASDPGYNGTDYIDTTSYDPGFDALDSSGSDSSGFIDTTSYDPGFDTLDSSAGTDTPDGLSYADSEQMVY